MYRAVYVCILLLGLSVPEASGEQPGRSRHAGPPAARFIEKHAEQLGIDETTRQAIQSLVEEARTGGREIRTSLKQARTEMRRLLEQDSPDEAAVMQHAERIGALRTEVRKNRLRAMLQIRALLSPEQRQALTALRQEKRPGRRRGGRFGACRTNLAELCPEAGPGRASLQCLSDNWAALSPGCQAVFERGRHRDKRRSERPD